jgi:DNA-binding response OmpR family regulator
VTDVLVLRWPDEQDQLPRLAKQRLPRLLLVEARADPPVSDDPLEDWVRLPSDDRDIKARLFTLRRRAASVAAPPVVDRHSRLVYGEKWAPLSPIEAQLAAAFVEDFMLLVTEKILVNRAWPEGPPTSSALRVHLHRLRKRIKPLGLVVRSVRSQGWVMQPHV